MAFWPCIAGGCGTGITAQHGWLHLFPNAAETTIHNHTATFVSFNGWSPDGALADPEVRPGRLGHDVVYQHVRNHAYFLSSDRFHAVTVPTSAAAQGPTLTPFYKDLTSSGPSYVLRTGDTSGETEPPPPRIGGSTETPETDPVVINEVYATMERCLRASVAALLSARPACAAWH
jgi:hypothetical protein